MVCGQLTCEWSKERRGSKVVGVGKGISKQYTDHYMYGNKDGAVWLIPSRHQSIVPLSVSDIY